MLQTKLYIPPTRPDLVPRPRLLERLNEGLYHKLILVSAPAGFGKTTLVSDWLQHVELPAAWLSLDEGDNDSARFFRYFIMALQQLDPRLGPAALAMLQSPQLPAVEPFMTSLLNDLANSETNGIIVLDDYHLIETPTTHEALTFLLEHLPPHPGGPRPGLRLVITSRADPPLPLPRLRGRTQLTELRAADLRFSADEAAIFLTQVMRLKLLAADIAALEVRTEGWITGLQLAALSLRQQPDASNFIESFTGTHRYILDYLTDEVLSRQPEELQTFLLQSSVLDRLTGPLCDAVTQREQSQSLLQQLEATNMFIVPLDNERRWYRYHPLFADVLRSRLPQTISRTDIAALYRRASDWYEQNAMAADRHTYMTEAINLSLIGEDFERAARLIAQVAHTAIWQRGEINTVLRWLGRLLPEAELAWPQLSLTHALLLAWRQQFDEAGLLLEDILDNMPTRPAPERDEILGQAATVRATIASMQGDIRRAMGFAREALEYLPEDDLQLRGISLGILGGIHRARGEANAGIQAYSEASSRLQAAGLRVPALIALAYLGQLQTLGGQLNQANDTYQQALQLAATWQIQKLPAVGVVRLNLGDLLRERNELEPAGHHLKDGLELCGQWEGLGDDIVEGCLSLARLHQARGDLASAAALIQRARQVGQTHHVPGWTVLVGACQARLWLAQGNVSAIKQWAQQQGGPVKDAPGSYQRHLEQLALCRLYLAEASLDKALTLLTPLRQEVEAAGRMGQLLEVLALQALALYRQGDITRALLTLSQALAAAEPEGYIRTFVDEGLPMAALLRRAQSQGIAPNYIGKLLDAFGDTGLDETALQPSNRQFLAEPLTAREQEVLRLLAAGRSNPQIAAELMIAVTTVKTHVKNIFGKLSVDNRLQAVARAQELNLL